MPEVTSINPYDQNIISTYNTFTPEMVNERIEAAHCAFLEWRTTDFEYRKHLILQVRDLLNLEKERYAKTITMEMGKPISQAIAEIEKCAWLCDYYAQNAESQLANENIPTDAYKSYVTYEPLGVVLAVMPWNYPFWQVFRFAIPALMAGNVGVLKHASNVFGSALHIEEIFQKAGFPIYCFNTLLIGSDMVEQVIDHHKIKAVTLTGSGPAGSAVASRAALKIKKSVLELGGNNALIVFDDCDLEATVKTCIQARFQNTGQSCIAGKRILVQHGIHDIFVRRLLEETHKLQSGDPSDRSTYIGVLAKESFAEDIEKQVLESAALGATIAIGGKRKKAYFEPTILLGVTPEMPMFKEESFGPAIGVTMFKTVDEAIELSNNSRFGLGVSIFTQNLDLAESLVHKLDEGAVFINELVKSDPRLPFGGIKESGYGRELSAQGIREFVNVKTVYIKK